MMKTSLFSNAGRLCRYVILGAVLYTSINAKLLKAPLEPFTIRTTEGVETSSKLTLFRGETTKQKKVMLKWAMAGQDNFTYTVEKSRDGQHFTSVDTRSVEKDNQNQFRWVDNFPKATNCYRLRITDTAGNSSYSKTLVVETFKSGDVELVGATPQVNLNDIQVDVQLKEIAIVVLHITNEKGEIILQQKERGMQGINQFMVKGSRELKAGDYFLKVVVNGTDRMLVHLVKS
jgi:hypothetical protein